MLQARYSVLQRVAACYGHVTTRCRRVTGVLQRVTARYGRATACYTVLRACYARVTARYGHVTGVSRHGTALLHARYGRALSGTEYSRRERP